MREVVCMREVVLLEGGGVRAGSTFILLCVKLSSHF